MMLWSLLVLLFALLPFAAANSIDCNETLACPYLMISKTNDVIYSGDPFYISALVYDCYNVSYEWRYDLQACIISGPASFDNNLYQQCTTITYYYQYISLYYYNTTLNDVADFSEVILSIQTQWPIIETFESNISVMLNPQMRYEPFCYDSRNGACSSGYGVPINKLNRCVQCDQYPLPGLVIFILIQIIPVTIMVFIIIVFNIQLTNGFIIGLVFYCQMISIVYPNLSFNVMIENDFGYNVECPQYYPYFSVIPGNIFNLNFLNFLFFKPICIMSNMTLLQAISFWYIIPTYPLVLLLLIYTWITMYDKGFRCVVTITRPLHRLLARFWHMTNIEPSLIHSIASIYLLCFTQFAATSLQLLYPTTRYYENENSMKHVIFYNVNYFGWPHSFAGMFAIIVLVFIIFLPMLYIQLYPLKLFHKILSCLHLRKEILISLGDIFTGPYKDGSDNTHDYRYFAGFYLFLRIIVLCLYFKPQSYNYIEQSDRLYRILFPQMALFAVFGGTIMVFRPYKRNIHSFFDFLFMVMFASFNIITVTSGDGVLSQFINLLFLLITFGVIVFGYIPYWTIKKTWICCRSCKANRKHNTSNNEEHEDMESILVDNNWDADRMVHPDNYDERHIKYVPYDLIVTQPEEKNVHVTYDNAPSAEISNIETSPLSESDSQSIPGSSNTIPLHPIVSTRQESIISNVNDEDEV